MSNLFKCRYCQTLSSLDKLAGTIQNQQTVQTLIQNIELINQKRVDLTFKEISEERKQEKSQKYEVKLKQLWTELKDQGDILICSTCWNKAKKEAQKQKTELITFTCSICLETKEGIIKKVHVANKLEQGIEPKKISQVCLYCYQNEIIPADYYCPLTSDGRSDWDVELPKYDCWCPTSPNDEYLTIEGETVKIIQRK